MSSLTVQNVSAINTLRANYLDTSVGVNQYRVGYEQGFIFNKIRGLENTIDVTINNYTSQYLTKEILAEDLLSFDRKDIGVRTITTPVIFNSFLGPGSERYLFIDIDEKEEGATTASQFSLLTSFSEFNNNIYFELEFLNETFLRFKHNNGKGDFFLNSILSGQDLTFAKYSSDVTIISPTKTDIFRYILDSDGYIQLYKDIGAGQSRIVVHENNRLTLQPITSATTYLDSTTVFKINYNYTELDPFINNSWVSYKNKRPNTHIIETSNSAFDRTGQYLLHGNYNIKNDTIDLNFLTLNNFRSEKNFIKRGENTTVGVLGGPNTSLRTYTSLNTGNDQEKGNDNITLTYVWYDEDIRVKSGMDTYFTAPSSIYPYDRLNINDAGFTSHGAFASQTPILSDKIYFLNSAKNGRGNERYLCTWLSGSGPEQEGLWVDRYYYPDILQKQAALSAYPVYAPSFETVIDNTLFIDPRRVAAIGYFDKRSDLNFTPGGKYFYSRVSNSDIVSIVNASAPLISGFDNRLNQRNNPQPYSADSITYNGNFYNRYTITQDINNTHSFTVSFEAYIDPNKKYGYQILGNLTDSGFGVINDEEITPLIFVTQDKKLNLYNTDFVLLQNIVFDKNIVDVIDSKFLDPFFVACEDGYLYKLTTAGVKIKLEIIPEITNYIAYYQDDESITFLLDNSGTCYRVDKNNLNVSTLNTVMLPGLSSTYTTQKGLVKVNETLYGLPEQKIRYVDAENIFFAVDGKLLIKQNTARGTTTQYLSSRSGIIDFNIDLNNNIIVLHDETKITILDQNRNVLESTDCSNFLTNDEIVQGVDIIKEYNSRGLNTDIVLALTDNVNSILLTKYSNLSATTSIGLSGSRNNYLYTTPYNSKNKYTLTNYNYYRQSPSPAGLNFKTTLTNYLSTEDILSTSIRVTDKDIDPGYHTFTYRFDPTQGNITLFIDGKIYENILIPPGKYNIQTIFNDDLFLGSTGFYNGRDLAVFLKQPGYYYVRDLFVRDLIIYNRPIENSEAFALNLYRKQIDDITISIPAGQRNNIETISRYFKYANTASSNAVDIVVKNANIVDESYLRNVRNLILEEAKKTLPLGVNINKIEFINYK